MWKSLQYRWSSFSPKRSPCDSDIKVGYLKAAVVVNSNFKISNAQSFGIFLKGAGLTSFFAPQLTFQRALEVAGTPGRPSGRRTKRKSDRRNHSTPLPTALDTCRKCEILWKSKREELNSGSFVVPVPMDGWMFSIWQLLPFNVSQSHLWLG